MRKFITQKAHTQDGQVSIFKVQQTPETIFEDTCLRLDHPNYLRDGVNFSFRVKPLPEGMTDPEDLRDDDPEQHSYMQVSGSSQALTIEVRVPDAKEDYIHYVVAREPVRDPDAWVPLSWENDKTQIVTVKRHPEEIFTGQQAIPVFGDYIINNQLPPAHLLRRITVPPSSWPGLEQGAITQPRSLVTPIPPGQRRFTTWTASKGLGIRRSFMNPQTPQEVADKITHDLNDPTFLSDARHFALGVELLPEGINFPEDMPPDAPEQYYIQAGGSHDAMTLEIRVPHPTDGYRQYTVAREPIHTPDAWITLSWDNGGKEPFTLHLHPEEIFTAEQATPIFTNFILNNQLPPNDLLRQIDA